MAKSKTDSASEREWWMRQYEAACKAQGKEPDVEAARAGFRSNRSPAAVAGGGRTELPDWAFQRMEDAGDEE